MLKIFKSTHSDGKQWKLLSGSVLLLEWNQKRRNNIDVAKEKIASTKCGLSISAVALLITNYGYVLDLLHSIQSTYDYGME